ncbi:MAG: hypothetical protein SGJ19_02280 [Planctomycetia bacterium]|nr:hypothetical protein [Planctomycetia bacterium]
MGIDVAHYHGWQGELESPWWSCLALVRVAILQVLRRRVYWFVLALGMLNFLIFWSIIYATTQLPIPPEARGELLNRFDFRTQPDIAKDSGYVKFMEGQSLIVMILLAFSGSLLVGADFRTRALPFYLSRRIDRAHCIIGKLLAVSSLIALLTSLPALLLFVEYGMFTSSFDYWLDNWEIAVSILSYGLVLCVVLSIWIVTLSAYLQTIAPIAITWSCLFVLMSGMANAIRRTTDNRYWELLDPWRDIRYVGRLIFGGFEREMDRELAIWAAWIVGGICLACLALLVRRVRAVDVVE